MTVRSSRYPATVVLGLAVALSLSACAVTPPPTPSGSRPGLSASFPEAVPLHGTVTRSSVHGKGSARRWAVSTRVHGAAFGAIEDQLTNAGFEWKVLDSNGLVTGSITADDGTYELDVTVTASTTSGTTAPTTPATGIASYHVRTGDRRLIDSD